MTLSVGTVIIACWWNITTHFNTKLPININLNQICLQEWRIVKSNKLGEIKSTTFPWVHDVSLPRRHQTIINRLRIGHILFTHENLMNKIEQRKYTSDNTKTTVKQL